MRRLQSRVAFPRRGGLVKQSFPLRRVQASLNLCSTAAPICVVREDMPTAAYIWLMPPLHWPHLFYSWWSKETNSNAYGLEAHFKTLLKCRSRPQFLIFPVSNSLRMDETWQQEESRRVWSQRKNQTGFHQLLTADVSRTIRQHSWPSLNDWNSIGFQFGLNIKSQRTDILQVHSGSTSCSESTW